MSLVDVVNRATEAKVVFQKEIGSLLDPEVKSYLEANPGIPFIGLKGYTPGFNDGEPCEFTLTPAVEDEIEQIEGYVDDDLIDLWRPLYDSNMSIWGEDKNEAYSSFIQSLMSDPMEDYFESTYGSDWVLIYYMGEDGELVKIKDHYDCGY